MYRTKTHKQAQSHIMVQLPISYYQIKLHNLGKFNCLNLPVKLVYNNSYVFVIQLSVISHSPFIGSVTALN